MIDWEWRTNHQTLQLTSSFPTEYEKVSKSTSKGETVYRDCTEICNKGTARYRMGEVQARQWTLTDEFAYAVCQLPVKYKKGNEYFQFLEDWGTVSCLFRTRS